MLALGVGFEPAVVLASRTEETEAWGFPDGRDTVARDLPFKESSLHTVAATDHDFTKIAKLGFFAELTFPQGRD